MAQVSLRAEGGELMIDDFGMGRDDPARSSVDFSEWGSEEAEEDLASGGRSRSGRRTAPQPYL